MVIMNFPGKEGQLFSLIMYIQMVVAVVDMVM